MIVSGKNKKATINPDSPQSALLPPPVAAAAI
jgi:hypothetical protein